MSDPGSASGTPFKRVASPNNRCAEICRMGSRRISHEGPPLFYRRERGQADSSEFGNRPSCGSTTDAKLYRA